MRGDDQQQSGMFSYVSLDRVPQDHPLRTVRKSADEVLRAMAKDFEGLYAGQMRLGLCQHAQEKLPGNLLVQQAFPVLAEHGVVPNRFIQLQAYEPAEQQSYSSSAPSASVTHASKTDPEARLCRKGHGQEAKLGYLGHALMENCRAAARAPWADERGRRQGV
jgi:hypothetical protein